MTLGRLLTVVGVCFALASAGTKKIVFKYDDSACSTPVESVTLTSEMLCTPQTDHYHPTCESSGSAYFVSDCISYSGQGYGDFWFRPSIRDFPYLIVDTYRAGIWWDTSAITSAMIYRLDEECHSNAAGTTSHKLSLDHSAIITTYNDTDCTSVATTTVLGQEIIGVTQAYRTVNDMKAYFAGVKPAFTAVAFYGEDTCTQTPSMLTITQDFICRLPRNATDAACSPAGGSLFSLGVCANDYAIYANTAFGGEDPFIMVESFANSYCNSAENVTVYSADDKCHANPDGVTSFKASVGADATAVISTYLDASCTAPAGSSSLDSNTLLYSLCVQEVCSLPNGCAKRYSVGGLGAPPSLGKKTIVLKYDDSSCNSSVESVTITTQQTCTPQKKHFSPVCESNGSSYFVSDCTTYYPGGWDDLGLINDAVGKDAFLVVEKYSTGQCGSGDAVNGATMYRLDEDCHSNVTGTGSYQLSLGNPVVITTYTDLECTSVLSTLEVQQSMVSTSSSANCFDSETKVFIKNFQRSFSTVAIYDDNSCNAPSIITYKDHFLCSTFRDIAAAPCTSAGNSLFSTSNCTHDYGNFSADLFGPNQQYVTMQVFSDSICSTLDHVTVYLADGQCHSTPDKPASFKATIDATGTTILQFFSDTACELGYRATTLTKSELLSGYCTREYICEAPFGCSSTLSTGGAGTSTSVSKYSVVAEYESNLCNSNPVQLVVTSPLSCAQENPPSCNGAFIGGSSVYQTQSCTDNYDSFALDKFSVSPYLIAEDYASNTNCQVLRAATIYLADGKCHPSITDQLHYKITQVAGGGTLTIATYPTSFCNVSEATLSTVDGSFVNTESCYEGNKVFRTGATPIAEVSPPVTTKTAISTYESNSCNDVPVQIVTLNQFPCTLPGVSTCSAIPTSFGAAAQSSECAGDTVALAAAKFRDTPYVVMASYISGTNCEAQEGEVVYRADGKCYVSKLDGSSFKISSTMGGPLTIISFPTAACNDSEADYLTVGTKYINTGACYNGKYKVYANLSSVSDSSEPIPTTPPVDELNQNARLHIMFPDWVWEPTRPRLFESAGVDYHPFPKARLG